MLDKATLSTFNPKSKVTSKQLLKITGYIYTKHRFNEINNSNLIEGAFYNTDSYLASDVSFVLLNNVHISCKTDAYPQ